MPAFVVRVWLPDRPGALGAVASRIGAVRGDVVGIEILERGAGRAIDELTVALPDAGLVDLLVAEVAQVDGVDVEDVRAVEDPLRDHRLEALESAARLVSAGHTASLLALLCQEVRRDYDADWAVVLDLATGEIRRADGEPPASQWLAAYCAGTLSSHVVRAGDAGPDDVAVTEVATASLALVLGRQGRPFRARERREVAALARIAERRFTELTDGRVGSGSGLD